MARRLLLKPAMRDVGERLLTSKLQILNGSGNRRPSLALSILTGKVAEPEVQPASTTAVEVVNAEPARPHLTARTVYLTEAHMRDIATIIDALQADSPRRLTRSAVLRKAIEHLRTTVEADSLLESQS
jgi:hypothetical protein